MGEDAARLAAGLRTVFDRWTAVGLILYLIITAYCCQHLIRKFHVGMVGDAPWHVQELHTQAWMIHSFLEEPQRFPHVNYFYPHRYTIAFTEPRILAGIIGAPAYLATGDFLPAFNLAYMLTYPLCAFGAFLMCRFVVRSVPAAFIGGLIFGFGPYMTQHSGQLSLLYAMFVPPGLAVAWAYGARPSWRAAGLQTGRG